jgi:outer membrane receptor for ferric coprogen and ferric-rhodotorulic acid
LGPQDVYEYIPDSPLIRENIIDTTHYTNNQKIKSYTNPDFRLAAKYIINPNLSLKASFSQLHQYIFMLSNSIALSPTDKWKLSDKHIKPMKGTQYSLGVFSNFLKGKLELSIEAYYKQVAKLVEYKDGADLLVTKIVETEILQGDLDAYGIEFMLKKSTGRFNGWFNYTYSSSNVLVKGDDEFTSINFGKKYPANYDKPHALNLVMNYKLSRRLSISGNVVYATGRPITYPTAIYFQDGTQITNYSSRNEYRLPDYFRMDLAVNLEGNLRKHKLIHGSWSLSVYNVTGRRNAYSVYFKTEGGSIKGYKLSIFGAPVVSLTYNFKLGNYAD